MYTGVHLLYFLNAAICSLITLFLKCIKLYQIFSQFSTINLAQVLDINIFGRDYSNFNNLIPSKDVNLQYIYKVYCREKRQHLVQQKRTLLALHFLKKYPTWGFFKFSAKRVFCPQVHIFSKVQMKLRHKIELVDDYCEQRFKYFKYYWQQLQKLFP